MDASPTTLSETPPTVTATPKEVLWFVVRGIFVQGTIGLLTIAVIAIFKIDTPLVILMPLLTLTGQAIGTFGGMLINTRQPVQQNGGPPPVTNAHSPPPPPR